MAGAGRLGIVQVYTGDGKGKTTAALGLALRASGAGLRVYIQQFMKKGRYNELKALGRIDNIRLEQCGSGWCMKHGTSRADHECARKGFERAMKVMASGDYDVVILDEINVAMNTGMIGADQVVEMILKRPGNIEMVLTGRGCPPEILSLADLITVMKKVRHPYDRGISARAGIEC